MCKRSIGLVVSVALLAFFASLAHGQTVYINFQTAGAQTPAGYLPDSGQVFGDRGNGWSYGWDRAITADSRERNSANAPDKRWDTLIHLQKGADAVWEIAIENGVYNLYIVAGDAGYTDQTNTFDIEGVLVEDPDGQAGNFDELTVTVTVADGRLTLKPAAGSSNSKICFIDIVLALAPEAARSPNPEKDATDVLRDLTLSWEPGEGVSAHDVYLGTSLDDVNSASRANPMGVLTSQGQTPASLDVGRLEFSQTYYWRIDEVLAADGSIYKGDVWSFTVEPFSYAVENVIATTNATSDPGLGIENTINGSGLDAAGGHSTASADMWLGLPSGADPVWIQYDFDQAYKLNDALVWNYNVQFEPVLGFGLQDVTIEYSADGEAWTTLGDVVLNQATAREGYQANTTVDFGGNAVKAVKITVNSNYGALPQYGLGEVRFMYIPATARQPQPASGAVDVSVDTALTWRPGRGAVNHDVYLGTDPEALGLAGSVDSASFTPDDLNFGSTYYWKVDEVNEAEAISLWEGGLWSFMVQEYATIDDFESYTDDEGSRIYESWLDGWVNDTGSTVGYLEAPFAEQSVVHSGSQSMPLQYDNSEAPMYSEAEYDLGGMALNSNGADSLRLFVSGMAPGFVEAGDGTILMNAIGTDIWNSGDQFRYAYKSLTGDGSLVARVDNLDGSPSTWAKAGVMIRQGIGTGSQHAFMCMTGGDGNGASAQARLSEGLTSVSADATSAVAPPYWVRLDRSGNTLTGYISADGETWEPVGTPVESVMSGPVLIGLALTSHNDAQATSAQFSNVSFTGNVTGAWQVAEIGATQPEGNTPESVYLALEDSSGKVAVVTNPDSVLTARSGWTEWVIPYSELTGINLGKVRTLYLGVGDRDNPSAGGSGILYIDDVGYGHSGAEVQ